MSTSESDIDGTPRERLAANLKTPYAPSETVWSALLDAFAAEFEELAAVRAQVRAAKFVDTADAASLERLAKRFELERNTDEPLVEFRARVKVALRSQLTSATLEETREIIEVLLDVDRDEIELDEPDDEPIVLEAQLDGAVLSGSDIPRDTLDGLLDTVTAAGVLARVISVTDLPVGTAVVTGRDVEQTLLDDARLSSASLNDLSSGGWMPGTRGSQTLADAVVGVDGEGVQNTTIGATTATIGVDAPDVEHTTATTSGLSAGTLDPLSTSGWAL